MLTGFVKGGGKILISLYQHFERRNKMIYTFASTFRDKDTFSYDTESLITFSNLFLQVWMGFTRMKSSFIKP